MPIEKELVYNLSEDMTVSIDDVMTATSSTKDKTVMFSYVLIIRILNWFIQHPFILF